MDGVEGLEPPSNPIRRLVELGGGAWPGSGHGEPAVFGTGTSRTSEADGQEDAGRDVEVGLGGINAGKRIAMDAFSPNYFRRFFVEERELGRGGKGVVLLVRHQLDGVPLGMSAFFPGSISYHASLLGLGVPLQVFTGRHLRKNKINNLNTISRIAVLKNVVRATCLVSW